MGLRSLIAFLTTIPVGRGSLEEAARSLHLAPLVGLLEGLVVAGGLTLLDLIYQPPATAAITMLLHLVLTGGLHMDGFTDYVEAVAARARGEEAERIIKDPRKGGFAIAYTTVLLIVRYSLLLEAVDEPWLVVTAYTAAAEAMYIYIYSSKGAGSGLAATFKESTLGRRPVVNLALYLSAILPGFVAGVSPIVYLAPLVGVLVARDSASRLGRPSGDAAGFSYEVTLTLALAVGVPFA